MSGERYYTTMIWPRPSSIEFSSAGVLSISMDPRGEPVISTWKRTCQKIQNGSEFPELVAQISRNPHYRNLELQSWFHTELRIITKAVGSNCYHHFRTALFYDSSPQAADRGKEIVAAWADQGKSSFLPKFNLTSLKILSAKLK